MSLASVTVMLFASGIRQFLQYATPTVRTLLV